MENHTPDIHRARKLDWPNNLNARDLGGLPAQNGRAQTRRGVFIRSDSPHRFTPEGIRAALEYGVRVVIDLRLPTELEKLPNPLAQVDGIRYLPESLLEQRDLETWEVDDQLRVDWNREAVIHKQKRIAEILQIMAEADGAVMFHCHAGKDRTGIIAAMLLGIAGAPPEVIAQDYALSDVYLAELYEMIVAKYPNDPLKQTRLRESMLCKPEAMLMALAQVNKTHGDVEGYLRSGGLKDENLRRIRARFIQMR